MDYLCALSLCNAMVYDEGDSGHNDEMRRGFSVCYRVETL